MRRIWVLALPALAAGMAAAQGLTPAQRTANLESFEKVWTTVRDKHWDPKLNGVDWQKVHDELKPRMEAAKTMDAAREVLNDMVGRLKQTHFGIFPGEVYHDLESSDSVVAEEKQSTDEAGPGMSIRV